MRRVTYLFLGLVLLLTGCEHESHPEAAVPTIPVSPSQTGEILLVSGDYPPYCGETLKNGGFTTELVRAVFAEMGYGVRIEFYPWERGEAMVENGEAWGTFLYSPTEERATRFYFSDILVSARALWFYYGPGMANAQYDELSDLQPYRIGATAGYWYLDKFQKAGLTLDLANDDLSNLNKLRAGRIDLFPLNEYVGWWLIQTHFADDVDSFGTLEKPLEMLDGAVMVSKSYPNSEQLLQDFNAGLAKIQQNGTYEAILKQYNMPVNPLTTPATP